MSNPDPILDRSNVGNERRFRLPAQIRAQVARARDKERASGQPDAPAAMEPASEELKASVSRLPLDELIRLAEYSPPDASREADPAYWKARFMVADGIAKRQGEDLRALHTQVADFRRRAAETTAAASARPALPAPWQRPVAGIDAAKVDLLDYYSQEEIEDHGEALLRSQLGAAMKAVAVKEAENRKREEQRRLAEQTEQRKAQLQADIQSFKDKVSETYPEWAEIDKDPRWRAWLAKENEQGLIRQSILNEYIHRRDVKRTVGMFRSFMQALGALPRGAPALMPQGRQPTGVAGVAGAPPALPHEFSAKGYKQWKSLLARSNGVYQSPETTRRINEAYDAAIANGTLPGLNR